MRCENVDCPDLRGVVVTPSEQAFLLLEENVRMLIKSGDKGQKHDSQWECAGHTLPSACACMHALLCYPASADPAYLTEPQHVCTDPHTRSVWCDTRAAAARGTSREVKMGTACA